MAEDPSSGRMTTRKWIAVFGTMLGAFMAVLDIQITNSSLADIAGDLSRHDRRRLLDLHQLSHWRNYHHPAYGLFSSVFTLRFTCGPMSCSS